MTANFERADESDRESMADVSHTNPHTDRTFGEVSAFQRGPVVAADGGEPNAERSASDADGQTMEDVDHEHPDADAEDANRVFERGADGEDGSV
jgi:hypothetical protein